MTGSIALDVVIGLTFIYLLYSLLATIICEIIAVNLGLRARNLHFAIRRMLEDSAITSELKLIAFFKNIWDSIKRLFVSEEGPASCAFFNLPTIKYLAENSFFSKPSYISSQTFSKAIFQIFRKYGNGLSDLENIHQVLNGQVRYSQGLKPLKDTLTQHLSSINSEEVDQSNIISQIHQEIDTIHIKHLSVVEAKILKIIKGIIEAKKSTDKEKVYEIDEILNLFGHETRSHMESLLHEANNDLDKYRALLEQWFDETMERAKGWYKRQIQLILLIIGLIIAIIFNVNTFEIVKKLAVDKDGRNLLVTLAINRTTDSTFSSTVQNSQNMTAVKDFYDQVSTNLYNDLQDANTILGIGIKMPPDSLELYDSVTDEEARLLNKQIRHINYERKYKSDTILGSKIVLLTTFFQKKEVDEIFYDKNGNGYYEGVNAEATKIYTSITFWDKLFFWLEIVYSNFWGYFLTAIAISLGAPFWFDLLNKLMQLRGSLNKRTLDKKDSTLNTAAGEPIG